MVNALSIAMCTSMNPLCCSVRAVIPSPAGTASSTPTRTTSESQSTGGGWMPLILGLSMQVNLFCAQVPVSGGCSEEPAQAPGLIGEAPWGQTCHIAEEHQGGSQLVSVDVRGVGNPGQDTSQANLPCRLGFARYLMCRSVCRWMSRWPSCRS